MRDRNLMWDGCVNVRDLGGHPTEDGRETRFGEIVRADSIRELTDAGWEALAAYGVETIVDLRLASELAADPPRDVALTVEHVSVVPELDEREDDIAFWERMNTIRLEHADDVESTREVYLAFLHEYGDRFGRAVSTVARAAAEGGVVVHCQGGKDRTGLVVALLLRLAGVPIADIARDYELSGENLRAMTADWIANAPDEKERMIREAISATPAAAMEGVVTELEQRHGGVDRYLRSVGVSDDDIARIRARLVG